MVVAPPTKKRRTQGTPFKRIDESKVEYQIDALRDNRFEAQFSPGHFSQRAHETLIKVRGKGFRHEMTKAKRGNYRGGQVNIHEVNSFKFPDSDDE